MPEIRWLGVTDSTNTQALALARAGAEAGTAVVADHQTAGRGRLDRVWLDEPGASLLASVVLRPEGGPDAAALAVMATSVAAVDACWEVGGLRPGIKWPNDLVVDDRKLAGVLAESLVEGGRVAAVVVGLGLNLRWAPEGAVALDELVAPGREPVGRDELLHAWLAGVEATTAWAADVLLDRYRSRCATIGRAVSVTTAEVTWRGRAETVDASGALVVEVVGGARRVVRVGDVVHLRGDGDNG